MEKLDKKYMQKIIMYLEATGVPNEYKKYLRLQYDSILCYYYNIYVAMLISSLCWSSS